MNILSELFEAIGTVLSALLAITAFVAIVAGIGYVLGWIFSVIWNATVAFVTPAPEISAWQGLCFVVLLNMIGSALTRAKKA